MSEASSPAYTTSILLHAPFEDLDEFFQCLDAGIVKQMEAGHPGFDKKLRYRDSATGEITDEVEKDKHHSTVHLCAYPFDFPVGDRESEWEKSLQFGRSSSSSTATAAAAGGARVKVMEFDRWGFNFALEPDWRERAGHNFSFKDLFPKCTAWLTRQGGGYHWMKIERKMLFAYKVKSSRNSQHCFQTIKHKSLHLMFAEMEEIIELPASWKMNKKAKK